MMSESPEYFIGIDWGSSNCRAALISMAGEVMATKDSPRGALTLRHDEFAAVFEQLTGDWITRHNVLFALASGMVGSKQGWLQAPYVNTPATMESLIESVQWFDQKIPVGIVPGIANYQDGRVLDILRGEEVQVFGVLKAYGISGGLLILPGTHSKWINVGHSRVDSFRTYMTGELFDVIKKNSVLKYALGESQAHPDFIEEEFLAGCHMALQSSLLHNLFGMRTRSITTDVKPQSLDSYYSGLLIGEEIRDGLARLPHPGTQKVYVVGSAKLVGLYQKALGLHAVEVVAVDEKIAFAGLSAMANSIVEHKLKGG